MEANEMEPWTGNQGGELQLLLRRGSRNPLEMWLDPAALFQKVLGPKNELVKVKYFTARVQPSPSDPNVNVRQDAYLRAL